MKKIFLKQKETILFALSLSLLIIGFVFEKISNNNFEYSLFSKPSFYSSLLFVSFIFYLLSLCILLPDLIISYIENIEKKDFINENLLMLISSIGAISLLEFKEAIIVLVFRVIAEKLESIANEKAKSSISSLLNSIVFYAHLVKGKDIIDIDPKNIKENNILEIRPGENIPCDGIIIKGDSSINLSSLTGESLPKHVKEGIEVQSGSINLDNVIYIKATKDYSSSTFSKILKLINKEEVTKSKHQTFMNQFAKVYTPLILGIAALYFIISFSLNNFVWENGGQESLVNALSILLIGCPCSLIISVPLSFFIGIGKASRMGIIIKKATSIESLNKITTFAFDKTGTITKGEFTLINKNEISKENLIIAASLESKINHPIARAFASEVTEKYDVENFKNYPGFGVEGIIKNKKYLLGSKEFLLNKKIKIGSNTNEKEIYLATNNKVIEHFNVSDSIKESAYSLVPNLNKEKVNNILMISGDDNEIVKDVAKKLNFNNYYSQALPDKKIDLIKANKPIAYVGDGINDSPSLLAANVGISMGQIGSDIAIESSDIIIYDDSLEKVCESKRLARHIIRKIYFGITISLLLKLAIIILISLNIISSLALTLAAIADTGAMIIAILNSLLIYKYKPKYLTQK